MIKKIKVLTVDDSAFMRRVISDIIKKDERLELVGVAKNGKEGLEKAMELNPDVITLDIEMPVMTGLEMLKVLQEKHPTPVVMLSTLVKEGARETILALELGAFDFLQKPDNIFKVSEDHIKAELVSKIIAASKVKRRMLTRVRPRLTRTISQTERVVPVSKPSKNEVRRSKLSNLVALGTSTGGPRALQYVIPYLPENLNAGIVIVQHMPPGFTRSLANRLDQLSKISVKEAEHGDIIENGKAYIAPGDKHVVIQSDKKGHLFIELSDGPAVGGHKPAVNVMMDSIVKLKDKKLIGVIMTGMGADGKDGMINVKDSNPFHIIAQNEETCVVYGMPKAVVNAGISDEIVPLEKISDSIIKQAGVL